MRKTPILSLVVVIAAFIAVPGGIANPQVTDEQLDLAEANVMGVNYSRSGGDRELRFNVTLYHDDEGEDGYANWWQVETLNGVNLGRRDLLHAHGTREFTRSDTIRTPEETRYVIVRGHDEIHGYGGRAAIVDLNLEEIEFIDQGSDPNNFSDYAETQPVEMKPYSNEEFGFKISYPKSWEKVFPKEEKNKEPKDHKEIFFRATSSEDLWKATSISVVANEVNSPVTLNEYEQYVELSNKFFPPGYESIYRGELEGIPAVVTESTHIDYISKTGGKNETEQTRKTKTVSLITRGNLYRITVSANSEDFDEANQEYFERILDSFEILPE
ncbi:MAG: hypothetical protein V5A81_01655 [Candidatus Bipolaricaulota bacterium]